MAKINEVIEAAMAFAVDRYAATGEPNLPDGYAFEIANALRDIWGEATRTEGQKIFDDIEELATKDAGSMFAQILQAFIDLYGAMRVQQITDATQDQIKRVIASGVKQGLGVDEIAGMMRESIPEFSQLRAHIIVRTETHSASMHASLKVAESSRLTLVKEWVATSDSRTRDFGEADGVVDEFSHRHMNGVTVALDAPFMVPKKNNTTEPLMYPGDPVGEAGNVINCRCNMIYRRA